MFKPTAKIKKILGDYNTYAYIHKDGIVIRESKEIAVENGTPTRIDVWHIVPCEILLRTIRYTGDSCEWIEIKGLHIADTQLIANGLESVEVSLDSGSTYSKEKGLTINVIKFRNGVHEWREIQIVDVLHSSVGIDMYGSDTILDYVDKQYSSGNSVAIHGDLPERIQVDTPKMLTVT